MAELSKKIWCNECNDFHRANDCCNICNESFAAHGNDAHGPCPPRCLLEVVERRNPEIIIAVIDFSLVRRFDDAEDLMSFYNDRGYIWFINFYSPDKEVVKCKSCGDSMATHNGYCRYCARGSKIN